jgi:hypothetical protein
VVDKPDQLWKPFRESVGVGSRSLGHDRARQLANHADLRLLPPNTPTPPVAAAPGATTPAPTAAAASHVAAVPPDPRLPAPGTILTRLYKGQRLVEVTVLPSGFAFQGKVFASFSALAKAITGSHCNGYHFFRLTKPSLASTTEANL